MEQKQNAMKSNMTVRKSDSNLTVMIFCLTLLFIAAQLSLFIIHYQVSDLLDSFVSSSLSSEMFHMSVLIPLALFLLLQFIAYLLFVTFIWFITVSTGELCKWSTTKIYWFGIFVWSLACVTIVGLNAVYYPDSFFASLLYQQKHLLTAIHIILPIASVLLACIIIFAYINFFRSRHYKYLGYFFLALACTEGGLTIQNNLSYLWLHAQTKNALPSIIIIGLDSLRPDFTSYANQRVIRTPHIDQFLQTSAVFAKAYTPLARTFPAWMSILTAQYPKHNQARTNLADPSDFSTSATLAKHLQQAGYQTMYASDEKRFSNITKAYGFDRVIGPAMGVNDFLIGGLSDFPLTNLLVNLSWGRLLFPYNYGNRAAQITYEPKHFLNLLQHDLTKRNNKPLFLAVHLCLTHWPFTWADTQPSSPLNLAERYRNSVEHVDTQFGKLLQILKEAGLLEHSIVVLLSDHGTAVGLPGDRFIEKKNYLGDAQKLHLIPVSKLVTAPRDSLDFQHDYTINTAYGQGTDVLSLKQYQVLLAFKGYGINIPAHQIQQPSSIMDIAPTLLAYLHLPPLANTDGISVATSIFFAAKKSLPAPTFFIESGDSFAEIETDNILVTKVIKHEIGIYHITPTTGLLYVDHAAQAHMIANKQRAVLFGDWLLARYPASSQLQFFPAGKNTLRVKYDKRDPYYVLVNLKTGKWSIGLNSSFAHTAPVTTLLQQLKNFYGNEI